MSGNIFWVFLILAVCSEANANGDLDQKKNEAQEKIDVILQTLYLVNGVVREAHEAMNYFQHAVDTYVKEEDRIKANFTSEVNSLSRQFVGQATDKFQKVNTFKCLLRVTGETKKALENVYVRSVKCIGETHDKQAKELVSTEMELDAIKDAARGLYQLTSESIKECQSEDCIDKLMKKVELRGENLTPVSKLYQDRISEVRKQFTEGQQACLNSGNSQYQSSLAPVKNNLNGCLR